MDILDIRATGLGAMPILPIVFPVSPTNEPIKKSSRFSFQCCFRLAAVVLSQVLLCFMNGNHYDSVYPTSRIRAAGVCQCELNTPMNR